VGGPGAAWLPYWGCQAALLGLPGCLTGAALVGDAQHPRTPPCGIGFEVCKFGVVGTVGGIMYPYITVRLPRYPRRCCWVLHVLLQVAGMRTNCVCTAESSVPEGGNGQYSSRGCRGCMGVHGECV